MSEQRPDARAGSAAARGSGRPSESEPHLYSLSQIRHLMRVEFSRAGRYGYPLACIMVAVDRLGALRDQHGYDLKEAILDDVVRLLRTHTRGCDYLGRLVDERLLAILPHTPAAGADVCAERLLTLARECRFDARGEVVRISLSIGVAHYEQGSSMYFDQLLDQAESAVQQAAAQGGDRSVHAVPARSAG